MRMQLVENLSFSTRQRHHRRKMPPGTITTAGLPRPTYIAPMCLKSRRVKRQGPAGAGTGVAFALAYTVPRRAHVAVYANITNISGCRIRFSTCSQSSAFKRGVARRHSRCPVQQAGPRVSPGARGGKSGQGHVNASKEVTAPSGIAATVDSTGRRRAGILPRPMNRDLQKPSMRCRLEVVR
jgi:hypothetical protein